MKSGTVIRIIVAAGVLTALCVLAACLGAAGGEDPQAGKWYSVVPPILAIVLAFLTRHVVLSLGIAIIAGGLLTQVPEAPVSAAAWYEGVKAVGGYAGDALTSRTNLQILAFIPPIFVLIEVVIASGGFQGVIRWLLRWVKGRKSAQTATALMGILCFIDDYSNAIIVGSMMQPITDRFRVSREKLAFIVDATSAPIAGLAVISTWIAYEVSLIGPVGQQLGVDKSGYAMFFDALSFRFYCLLMIAFVFLHILMGLDFGPMKKTEERARTGGPTKDVPDSSPTIVSKESGRALNALVPLGGLILFHISGLWIDGGGPAKLREGGTLASWVYWREVISNAKNSHLILACAALFGLTLALVCGVVFESLRIRAILRCFCRGIKRAIIPFAILILAWSLKNCCDSLKTGEFLTTILAGRVSACWFPPILFLVASVTSFATGTSYGTMAILIPTAIPVAFALDGEAYGLTTMISLGAVLDGAIFGDHCSPISDTTIMSSIASSCDLIEHVRTQLPYSLFVAGLALVFAYLPSAFGLAPGWSMGLSVLVMACLFVMLIRHRGKKKHSACPSTVVYHGNG